MVEKHIQGDIIKVILILQQIQSRTQKCFFK